MRRNERNERHPPGGKLEFCETPDLQTNNIASHCVFCAIASQGEVVAYENKHFLVRFDKFPASPGHVLIIPKRHVVSVFDIEANEWIVMQDALIRRKLYSCYPELRRRCK